MRKEGFGAEFRFERSSVNAARLKPELGDTTSDEKKHDVDSLSSTKEERDGEGSVLIGSPSPLTLSPLVPRGAREQNSGGAINKYPLRRREYLWDAF